MFSRSPKGFWRSRIATRTLLARKAVSPSAERVATRVTRADAKACAFAAYGKSITSLGEPSNRRMIIGAEISLDERVSWAISTGTRPSFLTASVFCAKTLAGAIVRIAVASSRSLTVGLMVDPRKREDTVCSHKENRSVNPIYQSHTVTLPSKSVCQKCRPWS